MYFVKSGSAFSKASVVRVAGTGLVIRRLFLCVGFVVAFGMMSVNAQTTFTNSTPFTIIDVSAASLYPSPIVVSGMSGNVTDVNVRINGLSHTFPDDVALMLVSPTGARMVLESDVGGGTDITNRTYTLDDQAAAGIPDTGPFPAEGASARPSSVGDDDTFPAPAPVDCQPAGECSQPAPAGTATLNGIFGGAAANGTWNLYVIDCCVQDSGSVSGGWSIIITTAFVAPPQHVVDFNGDGRTDFSVVRNTGGGPSGQITWFNRLSGAGTESGAAWGIASDFFTPEDFDGDLKTDIAVWRPGAPTVAAFYILQSLTNTVRIEPFGQTGDDPSVVGDYNNDGSADVAVYRAGATAGTQSTWFYRTTAGGPVTYTPWGQNGDFPAPGDYDGDGRHDFVIQRDNGGGQARFWKLLTTAGISTEVFGTPSDTIVPGDYDGDGKTDLAVVRGIGGVINWFYEPSGTAGTTVVYNQFGASATDFVVQGDYDGDGRTDIAVWRPNADPTQNFFWTLASSNGAVALTEWGQNGDYPIANYNTH